MNDLQTGVSLRLTDGMKVVIWSGTNSHFITYLASVFGEIGNASAQM